MNIPLKPIGIAIALAVATGGVVHASAVCMQYTSSHIFAAESYAGDYFRATQRAVIHDVAVNNGYALAVGAYTVDESRASREDIEQFISDASFRHASKARISRADFQKLLASIVLNESAHNSEALSRAGAIGVGQVMPFNSKLCGLVSAKDLVDPESNVDCSAQIIAANLAKVGGDKEKALMLYNWGRLPDAKHTLPAETAKYVSAVISGMRG